MEESYASVTLHRGEREPKRRLNLPLSSSFLYVALTAVSLWLCFYVDPCQASFNPLAPPVRSQEYVYAGLTAVAGTRYGNQATNLAVDPATNNTFVLGTFSSTIVFRKADSSSSSSSSSHNSEKEEDYDENDYITLSSFKSTTFLACLTPQGTALWAVQFTNMLYTSVSYSSAIDLDSQGNPVIAGTYVNYVSVSPSLVTLPGDKYSTNVYLAKFSGATGEALWATYGDGNSINLCSDLLVSKQPLSPSTPATDDIFVVGYFAKRLSFGTIALNSDNTNYFFLKMDSQGNFLWAKQGQPAKLELAPLSPSSSLSQEQKNQKRGELWASHDFSATLTSIAMDTKGRMTMVGTFSGVLGFPSNTPNAHVNDGKEQENQRRQQEEKGEIAIKSHAGLNSVFLVQFDRDGEYALWATTIGGNQSHVCSDHRLALDHTTNDCYVSGCFTGTLQFNSANISSSSHNIFNLTTTVEYSNGIGTASYLARYDGLTGAAVWAMRLGGEQAQYGTRIASTSCSSLSSSSPGGVMVMGFFQHQAIFPSLLQKTEQKAKEENSEKETSSKTVTEGRMLNGTYLTDQVLTMAHPQATFLTEYNRDGRIVRATFVAGVLNIGDVQTTRGGSDVIGCGSFRGNATFSNITAIGTMDTIYVFNLTSQVLPREAPEEDYSWYSNPFVWVFIVVGSLCCITFLLFVVFAGVTLYRSRRRRTYSTVGEAASSSSPPFA